MLELWLLEVLVNKIACMHLKYTLTYAWIQEGIPPLNRGKKPVELTFKPKARLIHLLGENLLRDEVTALLELVKNAYDADSPICVVRFESLYDENTRIIIEDSGTGMDISTVTTAWVEPGTSFKLRKPVTPKGRRVQGEKGIGRFAVDKLAKKLDMFTKTKGMTDVIHFSVDWGKFDDADRYLEDVKAQYSFEKMEFKTHGTKLAHACNFRPRLLFIHNSR